MPLIFQYGSNCDATRLNSKDRLDGAAIDHGPAETIEEYEVSFAVWSKGNACAASNVASATGTGHHAWGVLYEVPADRIRGRKRTDGKKTMEDIEGSHYEEMEKPIRVRNSAGAEVEATTFVVKPSAERKGVLRNSNSGRIVLWTSAKYVGHIISGLRAHAVPEGYVQHIVDIALDANRRVGETSQDLLIESLRHTRL